MMIMQWGYDLTFVYIAATVQVRGALLLQVLQ